MFQNQRRGNSSLSGIIAVALVVVAYLAATGLMVKVYREGASVPARCEMVCRQAGDHIAKG